jgi:hypothetical protein
LTGICLLSLTLWAPSPLIPRSSAAELSQSCGAVLSPDHPRTSCALSAGIAAQLPLLIRIPITSITNPALRPISIAVSLVGGDSDPILIGAIGLYPPNKPASFVLRVRAAFERLSARPENLTSARILLELLDQVGTGEQGATPSVVVGPLEFTDQEPH